MIVFDDLEAAAKASDNPSMRKLTFGVTFEAPDRVSADRIAEESMADSGRLGQWHVEPVADAPKRPNPTDSSRVR
jgi:hypothetical protein